MGAVRPARMLLPRGADWEKWAVVACDQYTSQPEYWEELDAFVGTAPSTLRMILPELYLSGDLEEKAEEICAFMEGYLEEGVFGELDECFILLERSTPCRPRRLGLVAAVDLECYDYAAGAKPLIRAPEGTIASRIPPRLMIRKNAPVEFPHVMLLADDADERILERLYAERGGLEKVYDFELNMGGGHVRGWRVTDTAPVAAAFEALSDPARMREKYGEDSGFLFAVGDGNHSLATAKAHWESVKKTLPLGERAAHPARFALAEIVSVYDDGICFEPIHRFVTGVDRARFTEGLCAAVKGNYRIAGGAEMRAAGPLPETIRALDAFIEDYIRKNGGAVDYVHGEDTVRSLAERDGSSVGILLGTLDKAELFRFVAAYGALPKKTFSMGEAFEKRYYIEGKKIR